MDSETREYLDLMFGGLEDRFEKIEQRLEQFDRRFGSVEQRLGHLASDMADVRVQIRARSQRATITDDRVGLLVERLRQIQDDFLELATRVNGLAADMRKHVRHTSGHVA